MSELEKVAVLDLETRCHLALARRVLGLAEEVAPAEVLRQLVEKKRAENHGDFQKLPYHEPVAAAVLLAERKVPGGPLWATEWRYWKLGDLPLEQFVERFFKLVSGRTYVGFNSQGFDLPLMELWASRCRVAAPEHFARDAREESPRYKFGARHCDLQKELVNYAWGSGNFDELCKFHGLPGKPGIGGGDVEALLEQGRLEEVHAYNLTDVLQTHLLYLHTLVRSGKLTRKAAADSACSALTLSREKLLPTLSEGPARQLLAGTLDGCEGAPLCQG